MIQATLPIELVLIVLQNLADRRADLQHCALVCHAWCKHSQAYIFRIVTLNAIGQCHRLLNLLNDSKHIAPLIYKIYFNVDIETLDDAIPVAKTLALLKRLESLSLGIPSPDTDSSRVDLPVILCDSVASTLRLPSLTALHLYSFSLSNTELQSLFMHAPGLRRLSLSNITCKSSGEQTLKEPIGRPVIEELLISLEDDSVILGEWLYRPNCSIDLSRIQTLVIAHNKDDELRESIDELLEITGSCLESLHLKRFHDNPLKDGLSLNLSHNVNLRSLRLDLAPNNRYGAHLCPPKWVMSTLNRLPLPLFVEELVIHIGIVDSQSFMRADYSGWRRMAALLSTKSFPSLQLVKIETADHIRHLPLLEERAMRAIQEFGVTWAFEMVDGDGRI